MKRSNRLVILVGVLLAVLAFVGVLFVLNQQGGPSQEESLQATVAGGQAGHRHRRRRHP